MSALKIGAQIFCALAIIYIGVMFWKEHHQPLATKTQATVISPPKHNPELSYQKVAVQKGDTLDAIFQRVGLSEKILEEITDLAIANDKLTKIEPGQTITLGFNKQHQLETLSYPFNSQSTLTIEKAKIGYSAQIYNKPVTTKLIYRSAIIYNTLEHAALRAGLNLPLYYQLRDIFQGTVNLRYGLHRGDRFAVLYKEYYVDGKKDHSGKIMFASFTQQNKTHYAAYYSYPKNHAGYYTLDGHGMEPRFLKYPVKFKRISSYFNYHRYDPFLHVLRPHLGIDLAANRGTPIKAIGDGIVEFCGRDHGYGNAVVISYGPKYKTLYGHMEKFAKKLHRGEAVKKGQIVGYVGSTGWSTGPHVHFEVYVYGKPTDPLQLKFPTGKSIPVSYEQRYLTYVKKLQAAFNEHQLVKTASNR